MPGCQEEEDVQKAITWLKNTVARCRRGGALGLGCQRTGREGTGKGKKLEEQEWNSVPGSSEPGALAWLVEYLLT